MYIPQEQGGPVIPLDTGFPFRRLLRLAGILTRLHTYWLLKVKLCYDRQSKHYVTKESGEVDVQIYAFLSSAVVGDELSASHPGLFASREIFADTHWIWGWLGPRAGLDDMKKWKLLTLLGLKIGPFVAQPVVSAIPTELRDPFHECL
jgi:hypothetical protein